MDNGYVGSRLAFFLLLPGRDHLGLQTRPVQTTRRTQTGKVVIARVFAFGVPIKLFVNRLGLLSVLFAAAIALAGCGGNGGTRTSDSDQSMPDQPVPDVPNQPVPDVPDQPVPNQLASDAPRYLTAFRFDPVVILNWRVPANHLEVSIIDYEYRINGGTWQTTYGSETNYVVDIGTLNEDEPHRFEVHAVTNEGNSTASNVVAVGPHPQTTLEIRRPIDLQALEGDGRVFLSWDISEPNDESEDALDCLYEVDSNGIWRRTDTLTAHVILGLQNDRNYTFRIKVVSEHGISIAASVSARTSAAASVPDTPKNLTATINGDWTHLIWDAPLWNGGTDITSYQLQANDGEWKTMDQFNSRSDNNCPYKCRHLWSTNALNKDDRIRVRGVNRVGYSAPSDEVQVLGFGLPELSVANATGNEVDGVIDFTVSLSSALNTVVTVDYATADRASGENRAEAGMDYTAQSGTLVFAIGETSKTVSVSIIDDGINDNGETFEFELSNSKGAVISANTAIGTITNNDPIPRAWLARFGRTVSDHVLDAVEERLRASRAVGMSVRLAGQNISSAIPNSGARGRAKADKDHPESWMRLKALSDRLGYEMEEHEQDLLQTLTVHEILMGSSFSFASEMEDGGMAAVWGRMARSSFGGREDELSLDGEVMTALLGADYTRGPWSSGLAMSHSWSDGDYRGKGKGDVDASLTALTPWMAYSVTKRLSMWGALGYGEGNLKLKPADQSAQRTDIDMTLAAFGARGTLVDGDRQRLDVVSDARWVRTTSEKISSGEGNLASTDAEVTRLRVELEGSWGVEFDVDAILTSRLALGIRHDGGDSETGFGTEFGSGVSFAMPQRGLTLSLDGRRLLTHEADGFSDSGFTGSIVWAPAISSGRGLSLTLSQSYGASASDGTNLLVSRNTLEMLDGEDNDVVPRRLEAKLSYELAVSGTRFTSTPEIGFDISDTDRMCSLGWHLADAGHNAGSFKLSSQATRREHVTGSLEHDVWVQLTGRW